MQFNLEDRGKFQVCSIIGVVNASNSEHFTDLFSEIVINCTKDLIVNLEHLEFIDSRGISTFLVAQKLLAKNGFTLFISNAPRTLKKLLDITFLDKVIPVFDDMSNVPGIEQS